MYERLSQSISNQLISTLKQVAQGQYVVSDTRYPALHDCELE